VVVEGGMSVINKMLQDLDRRHALGAAADAQVVRPAAGETRGRGWFWLLLVALLGAGLAWMAWVAFQIHAARPLVTDAAFRAGAEAQTRQSAKPALAPPPIAPPTAPTLAAPPPAVEAAKPESVPLDPPSGDALRLALQLANAAPDKPAPLAQPKPKPMSAPQPQAKAPAVDKRERPRSASDTAEAHFRRAVLLLNHGRVSEAEDQLIAALNADPAHSAARQTYVALLLEQQRTDAARRVLQQALALNPGHATFALALARIHAEQRDYHAALEVMERAGSVSRNADFQALRGAVLQRLARHGEAVEAYQNAIRGGAQPATTWVGLGISLEALGRKPDAAQAYRRALAAGPIAPEAREYAESRARALE
jgi:MSHA biogenesis protein MshN